MRTPATIIFPMPERLAKLQKLWQENGLCQDELTLERHTDEVIDSIVSSLNQQNVAYSALMTLAANDAYMNAYYGYTQDFSRENSSETHKLGMDFLNLFCEHGLYRNGKFDYVYSGRCSNKEIILIHYN
jgi:hypothetical protein